MKVVENISNKKWLEILKALDQGSDAKGYSFTQTPDFSSIICKHIKNYEQSHRLFVFNNGAEILLPLIKIKHFSIKMGKVSKDFAYNLVSLPLGAYGGFISASNISDEQISEINDYLISINTMGILIINHPQSDILLTKGFREEEYKTLVIPLDCTYDDIWKNRFRSKLRAEIRRAQKDGVVVRETKDEKLVENYLRLSEESMKKWAKRSRLPISLVRDLIHNQDSKLWIATIDGQMIAGVLILCSKSEMLYYQSVMDRKYSRYYPTKYIFEFVIKYGIENDFRVLNLGSSSGKKSIEHFKMSFNPDEVTYKMQRYSSKFWSSLRKYKDYLQF